jgi:betaine-aldehyde dehydrogenase
VMDAVLFGAFFNAGECCNAGSRLILHRSLAKEFLGAVAERAKVVPVGDPLDNATKVGAIITGEHLSQIETYLSGAAAAGAAVTLGGTRLAASGGQYMAPTIVSGVTESMAIASEEVFGPVLSVQLFDDRDDAIRIANATTYGLSASVWSRDIDMRRRFARRAGRHCVGEHIHGWVRRIAVRWLQAIGPWSRTRPSRRRRLPKRRRPISTRALGRAGG